MRDFRMEIGSAETAEEAAGYAGQMVRAGQEADEELFALIRSVDTSEVSHNTPAEVVAGLHMAVGVDLGMMPKKALSPSVEKELEAVDMAICAAQFMGMKERADEIEAMVSCVIDLMPGYYAQSRLQQWAHEYAESVGVKDPNQIFILRAILEARSWADGDLRKIEGVNPIEIDNENRKFLGTIRARNLN